MFPKHVKFKCKISIYLILRNQYFGLCNEIKKGRKSRKLYVVRNVTHVIRCVTRKSEIFPRVCFQQAFRRIIAWTHAFPPIGINYNRGNWKRDICESIQTHYLPKRYVNTIERVSYFSHSSFERKDKDLENFTQYFCKRKHTEHHWSRSNKFLFCKWISWTVYFAYILF